LFLSVFDVIVAPNNLVMLNSVGIDEFGYGFGGFLLELWMKKTVRV
jgi:hypothetical protein